MFRSAGAALSYLAEGKESCRLRVGRLAAECRLGGPVLQTTLTILLSLFLLVQKDRHNVFTFSEISVTCSQGQLLGACDLGSAQGSSQEKGACMGGHAAVPVWNS